MITADQVKALNKKIETINAQGTRAKAKLEVLEGNLGKSLQDYQQAYGVDLRGKSMKATAANIQRELASVEAEVQREYLLREQVVAAIERGDIDEANRLLGVTIVVEDDDTEDVGGEEPEEAGILGVSLDDTLDNFGIDDPEGADVSMSIPMEDEDDEADAYTGIDGDGMVAEGDNTSPAIFGFNGADFGSFEDDDDDPPAETPKKGSKAATSGSNHGSSASTVVADLEGSGSAYDEFGLTEDDLEDFGFGSMLSGTKFGSNE